jgi:2-polyprenyl-3-methyl-5-hydroxy-6-metoxy-1,4-benzoquinol methylase
MNVRNVMWRVRRAMHPVEWLIRRSLSLEQSEERIIGDSQRYWNDSSNEWFGQFSHWRGFGIFADDSRWLELGRAHFRLYEEFCRVIGVERPLKRIVEWGCGGGMNAVQFGPEADEFYGVDIAQASLNECGKQMASAGILNFVPVLIEASDPEAALARVRGPCDLFFSAYVFECLPSPEYGVRVLRVAYELLRPSGMAIIQIKYSDMNWRSESRKWAYGSNLAWNATYRIEEFWLAAEERGFTPKSVTLLPKQPLLDDRNYAYFLLLKPGFASPSSPQ